MFRDTRSALIDGRSVLFRAYHKTMVLVDDEIMEASRMTTTPKAKPLMDKLIGGPNLYVAVPFGQTQEVQAYVGEKATEHEQPANYPALRILKKLGVTSFPYEPPIGDVVLVIEDSE